MTHGVSSVMTNREKMSNKSDILFFLLKDELSTKQSHTKRKKPTKPNHHIIWPSLLVIKISWKKNSSSAKDALRMMMMTMTMLMSGLKGTRGWEMVWCEREVILQRQERGCCAKASHETTKTLNITNHHQLSYQAYITFNVFGCKKKKTKDKKIRCITSAAAAIPWAMVMLAHQLTSIQNTTQTACCVS